MMLAVFIFPVLIYVALFSGAHWSIRLLAGLVALPVAISAFIASAADLNERAKKR